MTTLHELRQQYPQYNDMTDQQFADAFHSKYYSDIPKADFYKRIGFGARIPQKAAQNATQPAPETSGVNNAIRATARGVPVLGSFLDEANAATNATLDPYIGGLFGGPRVEGDTWGERYENALSMQRGMDRNFDEQNPALSTGLQIGGGLATGGALLRGAPAIGSKFLGIVPSSASLGTKAAAGALSGGAIGAAHGFGSGEGGLENRLGTAGGGGLIGAGLGAAAPAVAHGIGRGVDLAFNRGRAAPTTEALRTQAQQAYNNARNAGVIIKKDSWRNFGGNLQRRLADEGIDETLHSNAMAALRRITDSSDNVTLEHAEMMRRIANNAIGRASSQQGGGSDARLGYIILDELDDYIGRLGQGDLISGNAPAANAYLQTARNLWSRQSKASEIERLFERARNRAPQLTGSGYENAIRTEFRQLAQNARRIKRFNKSEQDMIRAVARGGPVSNMLRYFSKFSPKNAVGGAVGAGGGYMLGGPFGSVAVLGGAELARQGSRMSTVNAAARAADFMRRGGPPPVLPQALLTDQYTRAMLQGANPATGRYLSGTR